MRKSSTLMELLLGIGALSVLAQVIVLFVSKNHLHNAIGLWAGTLMAGGMAIHMSQTIYEAVDLGADNATKYMQRASVTRIGVVVIVMALLLYFKIGNPITLVIGLFTLKISAYLQPFIHKLCEKRNYNEEESFLYTLNRSSD